MKNTRAKRRGDVLLGALLAAHLLFLPLFAQTARASDVAKPAEIESAIAGLSMPLDAEKLAWIQDAIARLGKDGQYLTQKLELKLSEVLKSRSSDVVPEPAQPITSQEAQSLPQEADEYKAGINALVLGRDASTEDIRKRDELVSRIARISDPNTKYDLLEYLRQREQSAQQ